MFIKAVKEAEKSVLVFNLDLGRVPIMNSGTMSRKVTESISAKAATAEGSETGRPSEDTIAVLEDTLSVMKGLEFFGKVTKPFQNKQKADDPLNGKYHTLPVKMVFKDKDAKARAETVLRNTCKVQCTTPYPPRLRKVIKDTVDKYRGEFPDSFIQAKVDLDRLQLRLSRKCKADGKWTNNFAYVTFKDAVFELGSVSNSSTAMDTVSEGASSL